MSQGRWPDLFAPQGWVTPDGDPINYVYESHGWPEAPVAYMGNKLRNSPHEFRRGKERQYEYALISSGPDSDLNADSGAKGKPNDVFFLYDSSNGVISAGDLIRFGPAEVINELLKKKSLCICRGIFMRLLTRLISAVTGNQSEINLNTIILSSEL